jgi:hypothetical protein
LRKGDVDSRSLLFFDSYSLLSEDAIKPGLRSLRTAVLHGTMARLSNLDLHVWPLSSAFETFFAEHRRWSTDSDIVWRLSGGPKRSGLMLTSPPR